jgi:N-carbamoyl-L-amino-acid hydrolase
MATGSQPKTLVNSERLWNDLMSIAELTLPDQPYTRRVFTPMFDKGREWLRTQFVDAGFEVSQDAAGNLIGKIEGTTPGAGTIMIGSHSDTVPSGGRFDGVAGVIAALEIGRTLKKGGRDGTRLKHTLEVVDFLGEEPNIYGLSCVGSRGISGHLSEESLALTEPGGEKLNTALKRIGGEPDKINGAKRSDIKAFFELHIEQGPVLESENIEIGIVTGIVGIRRIEIVFMGEADHAGTTPMNLRKDAGAALAETIVFIRKIAEEYSTIGLGHFVATVGVMEVEPNAINVVPQRARLIIDARSENSELMERFLEEVTRSAATAAESYRVKCDGPKILSDSIASICNAKLKTLLGECARDMGLTTRELASGAGHDANFISRIAPAAMVFVPCLRGKSHAPEEWAEPAALAQGANVIAEAILRLDASDGYLETV